MTDIGSLLRGKLAYLAAQDADSEAETVASWSHDSEFLRLLSDSPARPRSTHYWQDSLRNGGDNPNGFFMLATSDDDGATWSQPRLVVDPTDPPNV